MILILLLYIDRFILQLAAYCVMGLAAGTHMFCANMHVSLRVACPRRTARSTERLAALVAWAWLQESRK